MFRRATFAEVIDALAALGYRPRRCGTRVWPYRARCPGHDGDSKNALVIGEREDGTPRLKCFARGCDRRAILEPLGLWFEPGERDPAVRGGDSRPARRRSARPPATKAAREAVSDEDRAAIAAAQRVWGAGVDPAAMPAGTYLATRLAWPPYPIGPAPPPSIRWLPREEAPPEDKAGKWYPPPRRAAGAIVYRFVRPGADTGTAAVLLEALDADGCRLEPRWRKYCGRKRGALFLAGGDGDGLVLAEGPVTAVASRWLYPEMRCVALGGVGKRKMPPLPPGTVVRVIVETDGDPSGRTAAGRIQDALHEHGIAARIARNPEERDAADVWYAELGERAAIIEESGLPRAEAEAAAWREFLTLGARGGTGGAPASPATAIDPPDDGEDDRARKQPPRPAGPIPGRSRR